jgi:hypothetical protein
MLYEISKIRDFKKRIISPTWPIHSGGFFYVDILA